jgi:hypothetical protein
VIKKKLRLQRGKGKRRKGKVYNERNSINIIGAWVAQSV